MVPSAGIDAGLRFTARSVAGPAFSVRVAVFDLPFAVVAVMVSVPEIADAVMVTEQVPRPAPEEAVVQVPLSENVAWPLVANFTTSPGTRVPLESSTVADAVEVSVPLAVNDMGFRPKATVDGAPASVSVDVAEPAPSVAVMVSPGSALVEAWMMTEQVPREDPEEPVMQVVPVGKVAAPVVLNVTCVPATRLWLAEPSLTVAVAVLVEVPSARTIEGFKDRPSWARGVNSVNVADPTWPLAVEVIVSLPGTEDALIATEQVPSPGPDVAVTQVAPSGNVAPPSVPKVTDIPPTGFALASFTVAVADDNDEPSAGTEDGTKPSVTAAAGPAVNVRVELPDPASGAEPAAEIDTAAALVPAFTVTEHVPLAPVEQVDPFGKVTSPLGDAVNVTLSAGMGTDVTASITVTVACDVDVPLAVIDEGLSPTAKWALLAAEAAPGTAATVPTIAPAAKTTRRSAVCLESQRDGDMWGPSTRPRMRATEMLPSPASRPARADLPILLSFRLETSG